MAGAQQSPLPPHISPSAPHIDEAGWHRASTPFWLAHTPEQHSALDVQSSHSALHPPEGMQRFAPPGSAPQKREQQSALPPHASPSCRMHILPSLLAQPASGAQCPTDCASSTHRPVQQSALLAQISPWTRQPSTRPQRIAPAPEGLHT